MAKLTKKQQQELASIKVWADINQSLVDNYPRIEESQQDTQENDSTVDFQAKVLEMVEQIGWEGVFAKLSTVQLNVKSGSKMEKAVAIYQEMVDTHARKDIIKKFMEELDMSKEGAATYHQNIKTKLAKSAS